MRYGYDMQTVVRTTVNDLAVNVFDRVVQMAGILGRADDAASAQDRRGVVTEAINARLTRSDDIYIDGLEADGSQSTHASQQASALALAFGVVPAARVATVGAYVSHLGIALGPVNGLTLLRALHDAGRDADMARILSDRKHPGWAQILAKGGTFTWESWTPSDREGDSLSHGWGSSALVAFQAVLLGVTPRPAAGAVGGPTFDITPRLVASRMPRVGYRRSPVRSTCSGGATGATSHWSLRCRRTRPRSCTSRRARSTRSPSTAGR
jgi:alpha-L-rhamnosidase